MKDKVDALWARVQANELIKKYDIQDPDDIDIEAIAWNCGVVVKEGPLPTAEAQLVYEKDSQNATIRLREGIRELGTRRFAIAHELGHWILHRGHSQMYLFKDGDIGLNYGGSPIEIEANIFARELLMPETMFKPLCSNANPSLNLISSLAEKFKTSWTATCFRYVEMSEETCAVVTSERNSIKWFYSKFDSNLNVKKGSPLHNDSYAIDGFHSFEIVDGMHPVPLHAWLREELPNAEEFILYEDSYFMKTYSIVLTLLWLKSKDPLAGIED